MKKLFPILMAVALLASACQLGGGSAEPTAVPLNEQSTTGKNVKTRVSEKDKMTQILIPAGKFTMGGIDPRAAEDEKPIHVVDMPEFWIDQTEVTNAMYALCVQDGTCRPPIEYKSETRSSYYGNGEFNDYPVVYIPWLYAKIYCEWAGRRLPTEAEWERAARGDDTRTYPWGDQLPNASRANFSRLVGDTTRVGSLPGGASPFGVLDMAGNVAEWLNDQYLATFYSSSMAVNPQGPAGLSTFNRVIRGGTFLDVEEAIRVSKRSSLRGSNPNATIDTDEWFGDYSPRIGFRCGSSN